MLAGPALGRSQGQAAGRWGAGALGMSASTAGSLRGSAEALGLRGCAVSGQPSSPLHLCCCDWVEDGAGWMEILMSLQICLHLLYHGRQGLGSREGNWSRTVSSR